MDTSAGSALDMSEGKDLANERAALFKQKVDTAACSCSKGDFEQALRLYDEAIELDPTNHVLYSNRSAIQCKLNRFQAAYLDAVKSIECKPDWIKAHYRKGHALMGMGEHIQALVAFSTGLALDPKNKQLAWSLSEAASKCAIRERFFATFNEMKSFGLNRSAFLLVSVVGQSLYSTGNVTEAIKVLETAVKIGTTSLKLQQSVLSTLSSLYYQVGKRDQALTLMKRDLQVAESLGDAVGELRAHSNLGTLYLEAGDYLEALPHFAKKALLEIRGRERSDAIATLSVVGRIQLHLAMYEDALKTLSQCVAFYKESGGVESGRLCEVYGCIGDVYAAVQQVSPADDAYGQMLRLARIRDDATVEVEALTRLGHLYRKAPSTVASETANYEKARDYFLTALEMARLSGLSSPEGQLCGCMSSLLKGTKKFRAARRWAEKQLDVALRLRDRQMEAMACAKLGDIEFEIKRFNNATKLYQKTLELVMDVPAKGTEALSALHRLGTCHCLNGKYQDALGAYRAALKLAEEANERSVVCRLHADLAFCLAELNRDSEAAKHISLHWTLSTETEIAKIRSEAVKNVGRYYEKCGDYKKCIEYMEKYLMIVQEENDMNEELDGCQILGDANHRLGCYREAIRFYNQALALAKDSSSYGRVAKAYRSLAVSKIKLGELDDAMECAKYFLAISHILGDAEAKCGALLVVGEVLYLSGKPKASLKVVGKAMNAIIASGLNHLQCKALGLLGSNYLRLGKHREALSVFRQERTLAEQAKSTEDLCLSCEHLGAYFSANCQWDQALQEYRKQVSVAKTSRIVEKHLDALWHIAETRFQAGHLEEARRSFQKYVDLLQSCGGSGAAGGCRSPAAVRETLLKIADRLESQKRWLQASKCYEQLLNMPFISDTEQRKLATLLHVRHGLMMVRLLQFDAARQELTECLNNRSVVTAGNVSLKFSLYRGIACCEFARGNVESASSCLNSLLIDACKGHSAAISIEELLAMIDLAFVTGDPKVVERVMQAAADIDDPTLQLRALEVEFYEQERIGDFCSCRDIHQIMSRIASRLPPSECCVTVCMLEGVLDYDLNNLERSIDSFQRALQAAVATGDAQIEAEVRMYLGVVYWMAGSVKACKAELKTAMDLVFASRQYDYCSESGFRRTTFTFAETLCVLYLCFTVSVSDADEAAFALAQLSWIHRYYVHLWPDYDISPMEPHLSGNKPSSFMQPGGNVLSFLQVDEILFLFCMKEGVFDMRAMRMVDFDIHTVAKFLDLDYKPVESACTERFETCFLPRYNLQLPYYGFNRKTKGFISLLHETCLVEEVASLIENHLTTLVEDPSLSLAICPPNEMLCFPFIACGSALRSCRTAVFYARAPFEFTTSMGPSDYLRSFNNCPTHVAMVCFGEKDEAAHPGSNSLFSLLFKQMNAHLLETQSIDKADFVAALQKYKLLHLRLPWHSAGNCFLLDWSQDGSKTELQLTDVPVGRGLACLEITPVVYSSATATEDVCSEISEQDVTKILGAFLTKGWSCVLVLDPVVEKKRRFYEAFYHRFADGHVLATSCFRDASAAVYGEDLPERLMFVGDDLYFLNACEIVCCSLRRILSAPDTCGDALWLLLHLVNKSLERLSGTSSKVMFTSERSILSKIGPAVSGWDSFLEALSFEKAVPRGAETDNDIGTKWYFPAEDVGNNLLPVGALLRSLIALPQELLKAVSKLCSASSHSTDLVDLLKVVRNELQLLSDDANCELRIHRRLWDLNGVADLFTALGIEKTSTFDEEIGIRLVGDPINFKKLSILSTSLFGLFNDLLTQYGIDEEDEVRERTSTFLPECPADGTGQHGQPSEISQCFKRLVPQPRQAPSSQVCNTLPRAKERSKVSGSTTEPKNDTLSNSFRSTKGATARSRCFSASGPNFDFQGDSLNDSSVRSSFENFDLSGDSADDTAEVIAVEEAPEDCRRDTRDCDYVNRAFRATVDDDLPTQKTGLVSSFETLHVGDSRSPVHEYARLETPTPQISTEHILFNTENNDRFVNGSKNGLCNRKSQNVNLIDLNATDRASVSGSGSVTCSGQASPLSTASCFCSAGDSVESHQKIAQSPTGAEIFSTNPFELRKASLKLLNGPGGIR